MKRARALSIIVMLHLGMGLTLSASLQQSPQESVSLSSHLVLLNLTVTDARSAYVGGLRQEDFSIFEDGMPQTIAFFGSEETPFAAAILIDVSGSMQQMIRIACAAARNFAQKMRGDDVFAVYVFADRVARVQDFGTYPELDEIVWHIQPEGYTALYDGVYQAVQDLRQRPERRRAILVLSDGADTRSRHSLTEAMKVAAEASVTIYTVNLMDPRYARRAEALQAMGALRAMAEKTGGRYIADPGGTRMYEAFDEIVEELRHQYTIGYYPTPEKTDGKWHKISVKVSRPGVRVRTRPGYRAPKRR